MDSAVTSLHYQQERPVSKRVKSAIPERSFHNNGRSAKSNGRVSPPTSKYSRYSRRKRHRSSRSRSRSSSPERDSRRNSSSRSNHNNNNNWYWEKPSHGRTATTMPEKMTETERIIRMEILSTKLAGATTQIVGLEAELHSNQTLIGELNKNLTALQRENTFLSGRNREILQVMKTLETGVEALRKEKTELMFAQDEFKVQLDQQRCDIGEKNEQMSVLVTRNGILSKKCADLLDGNKAFKERAEVAEAELDQLRPLEKRLQVVEEEKRAAAMRLATFEAREKLWINEKFSMEKKLEEAVRKRKEQEVEVQKSAKVELEGTQLEHLKALHSIVESLHAHHRTEISLTKSRLAAVLKKAAEQSSPSKLNQAKKTPPKSAVDTTKKRPSS